MLSRITLLVLLACCVGPAVALSLGEIEAQSALYQRLSARIELQQGRGEDVRDLQVSLASAADFKRMGVERNFMLTQLQFEVIRERGQTIIEITTRRPVVEPYLDFVVDIVWRQGRMLKEYTVLLDPPGLAQQAPVQSSSAEPATPTSSRPAPPQRSAQTGNTNSYGPTKRNDTMWSIARRTLPDRSVSIEQHMLAIKRLNPDAFINDNINLLKQGQILTIPSAAETASLSRGAAVQKVQDESRAWQERSPAPAPSTEVPGGQLRIVTTAGDRAGGLSDTELDAKSPALAPRTASLSGPGQTGQLDLQMDNLEQVAGQRLASIQQKFAAQSEALLVKDQQLAELKAQVQEMQQEMARLLAEGERSAVTAADSQTSPESPWLWLGAGALAVLLVMVWLLRKGTGTRP